MIILDDRLKRIIQKAKKYERKKTQIFWESRKNKEIRIVQKHHARQIKEKNKEIKRLKQQHTRDIQAYELYKEEQDFLNDLYTQIEPNFYQVVFSVSKIFQKFKTQQDKLFLNTIKTKNRDKKIKKLLKDLT
jgi:hypothetical protein